MAEGNSVETVEALQKQAQQQYIDLSVNQIKNEMAAQEAQIAKEVARAWSQAK